MLNGSKEFCQEFLTDVRVPDSDRIGEVDDGWTVGTRWMFHERMLAQLAARHHPGGRRHAAARRAPRCARSPATPAGSTTRAPATSSARPRCSTWSGDALKRRVGQGIATGTMSDQASAIARLFGGLADTPAHHDRLRARRRAGGGVDRRRRRSSPSAATTSSCARSACIGGGTTEMAANVISERVLGMPRERSLDRDVPFRDVPRSPS